ncbi:NAD(P)/FAD-dependent oxidoreductase [Thalassotalea sp. G2M2-11]|uniref:NAD(P)/FAD-dependent oxidoreductase n=1 Tax=Thalassotalea sp. G2M2-11 TaxID=2787627 RepID=UPI0019D1A8AA|nr:NAD(P)/FAD-dependent oxidoreductase [Thalassotalea sp. G2M2-11]
MEHFDAVIVGAGVVGLAIAAKLSEQFSKVLLIDKNACFGEETSSRNSEVIHAGIYYPSSSLKAKLCVQGKEALYRYCEKMQIPHQRLGKFLVAHNEDDEDFLHKTVTLAEQNGVCDLTWRTQSQLRAIEPELAASAALSSPSTGIIDVHSYMQSLLVTFQQNGGLFVANTKMNAAEPMNNGFELQITSVNDAITLSTQYLINSGGLHSSKVATTIAGLAADSIPALHYCRGHYFSYMGKSPFEHLIYPIPEANGLGIHASLDIGGQLKFGPDTQYINELSYGVDEQLREKFYLAIKQYFPRINREKLQPAYAGIRPKLQGENDGFCDFKIQTSKEHQVGGLVNLYGIDSPGLTSSLAIAEYVLQSLLDD